MTDRVAGPMIHPNLDMFLPGKRSAFAGQADWIDVPRYLDGWSSRARSNTLKIRMWNGLDHDSLYSFD